MDVPIYGTNWSHPPKRILNKRNPPKKIFNRRSLQSLLRIVIISKCLNNFCKMQFNASYVNIQSLKINIVFSLKWCGNEKLYVYAKMHVGFLWISIKTIVRKLVVGMRINSIYKSPVKYCALSCVIQNINEVER